MTIHTLAPAAPAALPHTAPRGLNLSALQDWLSPRLPGAGRALAVSRIDGGQSNPSWKLVSGDRSWVLRAKPGPAATLLPSAHAIERECRVLQALEDSGVPVPRVRALCEDESVIGAAFYVMDFVDGRIFRDAALPQVPVAGRGPVFDAAGQVLARLHAVDWRARGLQDFGRTGGYYQRLIRRWTLQYRASVATPCDAMEQLAGWLPQHIPSGADDEAPTCLTHGDFRLENLVFHPTRPDVVAVLDWELSTLGHPLSDLAYLTMAWQLPAGLLRGFDGLDTAALGLPSAREVVAAYCARTGRDPSATLQDWPFYLAFNLFRLGAILHGIASRQRAGRAASASAAALGALATPVAERGWAVAQGRLPAI